MKLHIDGPGEVDPTRRTEPTIGTRTRRIAAINSIEGSRRFSAIHPLQLCYEPKVKSAFGPAKAAR